MTYGAYAFDDKGYDFSLFETTRGTAEYTGTGTTS